MTSRTSPRPARQQIARLVWIAVGLTVATLIGVLGWAVVTGSVAAPDDSATAPWAHAESTPGGDSGSGADGEFPGEADGAVPWGATVFDDHLPAVANLDPELLDAIRRAADAASADEGIEFQVNSGWRSAAYQEQLLRDAVDEYGSPEEAARWVSTAETSFHVSGDAIDIGPFDATYWLMLNGAAYGLCQIYGNESWHYELRPYAVDDGCPPMYADPTEDPRMRG